MKLSFRCRSPFVAATRDSINRSWSAPFRDFRPGAIHGSPCALREYDRRAASADGRSRETSGCFTHWAVSVDWANSTDGRYRVLSRAVSAAFAPQVDPRRFMGCFCGTWAPG